MEGKPIYYDGSVPHTSVNEKENTKQNTFEVTDEMRKNVAGNPYNMEKA